MGKLSGESLQRSMLLKNSACNEQDACIIQDTQELMLRVMKVDMLYANTAWHAEGCSSML
jgi:hypothetical protein